MAIAEFHLSSNNCLGKQISLMTIVPDSLTGPFPVLYLLGGLSDDHTTWHKMTGLQRLVDGLPLIVTMPNGERGFYTDAPNRPFANYESYVARDVVGFVDRTFNTINTPEGRAIAGLSMGGYGALKFALKYPELFSAAASLSGALALGRSLAGGDEWFFNEFEPVFGDPIAGTANDLFTLAAEIDSESRPPLFLSCGTEDFLLDHNRQFSEYLSSINYFHDYEEHPGNHNWSYWNRHLVAALEFLLPIIGIRDIDFAGRI